MESRTWPKALLKLAYASFITLCLLSASGEAQTVNGAFHGTVTDASGAVMPGVAVKISNEATNAVRQATTNAAGFYTVTQIPPGVYTFEVSKSGFSTVRQTRVQLLVNQDLEVNFSMQVGQVSQQVQVTATPPALDTANATIGQVVGSQQVVDLPLNGRQFTQLILLTPGAAPKENGQQGAFTISIGGGISPSVKGNEASRTTTRWTEFSTIISLKTPGPSARLRTRFRNSRCNLILPTPSSPSRRARI